MKNIRSFFYKIINRCNRIFKFICISSISNIIKMNSINFTKFSIIFYFFNYIVHMFVVVFSFFIGRWDKLTIFIKSCYPQMNIKPVLMCFFNPIYNFTNSIMRKYCMFKKNMFSSKFGKFFKINFIHVPLFNPIPISFFK